MISRRKTLALILGFLTFALMPLSLSAATRPNAPAPRAATAAVVAFAGGVNVPITGTTSKGGKFSGNFAIQQFKVVGGQIVAVGTLTGTVQMGSATSLARCSRPSRLSPPSRARRATSFIWSWGRSTSTCSDW